MDKAISDALAAHGDAIYRAVERAHDKMAAVWSSDEDVARLPELEFSGIVTQLAKVLISDEDEGIRRGAGASAIFCVTNDDQKTVRFRLHRARLKPNVDPEAFGAEDLESPRLNGISTNTRPDFLILWVSEGGELLDIFAVVPKGSLEALEGTQTASYETVRGRRWRASVRLTRPVSVPTEVAPVEADVDLGIESEVVKAAEEEKRLG